MNKVSHIIWLAIGLLPNLTPTPLPASPDPPPPPGKTLVIREPYQSPEHAFDSFLKDDLPDQNKNVEKCKQQSENFKSSSSLWKKETVPLFTSLSLSLQGLHGFKVFTRGYKGYNELQGVTGGYKGLYPSWLIMVKDQHALVIDNGKIKIVCVFWPVEWCLFQLW